MYTKVCYRRRVLSDAEKAEAMRQAQAYYWIAEEALNRSLPAVEALYRFCYRQLAAYAEDGLHWHVFAATAAARDATDLNLRNAKKTLPEGRA